MKIPAVLLTLFVFGLLGCVNLKPQPDRTGVFILAGEVPVPANPEGLPEVYVARVELPGFLEGTRIHYRSGNGRLETIAGSRWADALSEALPRAIAMHLQSTQRANVLAYYPWTSRDAQAAVLSVRLEHFSANSEGRIEVVARWQLESKDGRKRQGRYLCPELIWSDGDAASYVRLLDKAIAGLAESIALKF